MKLDMKKFGSLQYKLVYTLSEDNNITNVIYNDNISKIKVLTDGIICNNGYVLKISDTKNKKTSSHNVLGLNKSKLELLNKASKPIIRGIHQGEPSLDGYSLPFNINDKEILMDFDKSVVTIWTEYNNKCLVFGTNKLNVIDTDKLIESYIFTQNGFVYDNDKSGEHSAIINSYGLEITYLMEYSTEIKCNILDKRPTYASFSGATFVLDYDENNLVIACKTLNNNNDELRLCRHESAYDDAVLDTKQFVSLHPLIYDPFDYEMIDMPLKNWALDQIVIENGAKTFIRQVYRIEESEKINKVISILNDEALKEPILL